jgi:hypothetical protein
LERGGAIQELAEHAKATTLKISSFSPFFSSFHHSFFIFLKKLTTPLTTHKEEKE